MDMLMLYHSACMVMLTAGQSFCGPTGGLFTQTVYINGSRVYDYSFELTESSYFTVGVLAHEFFHVLGAPDLYHYNSNGAPTAVGGWDVMESTANPPQYMGAYMKWKYGD